MGTDKKTGLSKAVLEMKFMKRTKERIEKEATAAAEAAEVTGKGGLYAAEVTPEMRRGICCLVESSMALCLGLLDGRRSYGGMNPEVERLTRLEENPPEASAASEVDVSDRSMAEFYNPLVATVQNKFRTKKQTSDAVENPENAPKESLLSKFFRESDGKHNNKNKNKRKKPFHDMSQNKRHKR